jgi:hypothetical protein
LILFFAVVVQTAARVFPAIVKPAFAVAVPARLRLEVGYVVVQFFARHDQNSAS